MLPCHMLSNTGWKVSPMKTIHATRQRLSSPSPRQGRAEHNNPMHNSVNAMFATSQARVATLNSRPASGRKIQAYAGK